MAELPSFNNLDVPALEKYLLDRGISSIIKTKGVLVRLCELADELDLGDLTKATSTKVIVSKDKSWTVEVGNKTIQLVPYNDVTIWSKDLNGTPEIKTSNVLCYMEQCGWSKERFISTSKKNEGYRLHLVCFFDGVKVARFAHQDYVYLRSTCTPETEQNDQSRDVWVLVEKTTGKIMFGGCNCEAGNGTCKHCIAFLFFLARRTVKGTDEDKNSLCVWKENRKNNADELHARNESESFEPCTNRRAFLSGSKFLVDQNAIKAKGQSRSKLCVFISVLFGVCRKTFTWI